MERSILRRNLIFPFNIDQRVSREALISVPAPCLHAAVGPSHRLGAEYQ